MLKALSLFLVMLSLTAFSVSARGDASNSGESRLKQINNISTRLCELKKNRSREYLKLVEQLSKKLEKIKLAAARLKTQGKDVSGVEVLVAAAQTKIDAAKAALPSDFTCPTITEANARTLAQSALNELKTSQDSVKAALRAANSAVEAATKALRLVTTGTGGVRD